MDADTFNRAQVVSCGATWPTRRRFLLIALGLAAALLAGLLLTACGTAAQDAPPDPWARYRPALKPDAQHFLDELGSVPRYDIDATLDPDALELRGRAAVAVPNSSQKPWTELVFRLYPMLDHFGGNMVIQSALIDGEPATFVYEADNTALVIDLERPLLPGQEVTVNLAWRLEIPKWTDQSAVYALFGRSQQMISLPLFYPSLAVFQPGSGPAVQPGTWWLDEGTERGDAAFNVTSLFAVTLTLPTDWVPVTSGTLVSSTPISATATQHAFVTGPSREFLLHTSPQFQSVVDQAYGTRVTSYFLPGQEAAGRAALKYAAQALRIYSDHFGEYPFADMRVAVAPLSFRGMEYPQVMLLGTELYGRMRSDLEERTVHEVAHQWWYQMVHNDPVNEPWLDEALAEFSMRIYQAAMRGEDGAQLLVAQRWQTPLNNLRSRDQDTKVNQPVAGFLNGTQYETVVYGKGALFYDQVRDKVGARRFERFLQNYLKKYRWQIVDTATWLEELRDLPDPSLGTLFEQWVALPTPVRASSQPSTPTPVVAP